ncbi:hypothetical protein JWV37_04120 [Sulfurospirillum sp. T05]|uniref:DUF7494 domain-containing protein n=1 Tax=Sulfurospirillum tamanense TaxID=2813362 RepID=A0ABS2WQJ3_9BACT|nr:hypothetical protein [Sulfurospirillum tamanensis]MBN2963959.1 hypothetical protein [Sulfurospirillum tamanensis]
MKHLLIFLIFFSSLHAVTLVLNSAQENNRPYAILHVMNDTPIECFVTDLPLGQKKYTCQFDKILTNRITSQKTPLVQIDFVENEESFEIVITPTFDSQMRNMDVVLHESIEVPLTPTSLAKHWAILIYQEHPFSNLTQEEGINFPVTYPKFQRPSVGALDLNGAPIGYVRSRDINAYLDVKRDYEAGRFENVIEQAQEAMMLYPQTIFKSEFALYKIRAMDYLLDAEDAGSLLALDRNDVIQEGKAWMKNFSSDENMAEALMLVAKNYLKMGFSSDANYFLDILITEYPESRFTKWAILLYADTLYNGTKRAEALRLYNDVLYTAKDLDMASEAAIRLAQNSIDLGKVNEAKEYLVKILNANAEFLLKDEENAYALAEKLALNRLPGIAAQISESLLANKTRTHPLYEVLLKDTGLWYAESGEVTKGHLYLTRYQSQFSEGEFGGQVQEGLDRLFFELAETNTTKLTQYYETLMARYDNEISQKALVEKAKLFHQEARYAQVLALDDALRAVAEPSLATEANQILTLAAFDQATVLLEEDQCQGAVLLVERYGVGEELANREKLFECLMRLSRFDAAAAEAKTHTLVRDLRERLAWMIRLNKALFEAGKWADVVGMSDDIMELGVLVKVPKANEVLYEKFFALTRLGEHERALGVAQEIMRTLSEVYKSVEVYREVMRYAKTQGNDLLLELYAKEALALQERSELFLFTPELEYETIQVLQRLEKPEEALEVAVALISRVQSPSERIRAQYYAGEISSKLGKIQEAKAYFSQCADASEESSWKSVCQQHLELIP